MRSRRNLLPVSEPLELPLRRGEVCVIFASARLAHRMNQNAIAIGHGGDNAGGDVILRIKNRRRLQIAIISLSPELSSGLDVDQLRGHPNTGATFADASLQYVTRAELVTQSPFVCGLSLHPRGR